MSWLRKRGIRYYLCFRDESRQPKRRIISLGPISEKAAKRLKARLDDQFALGEFDPWKVDKEITLNDAVKRFLRSRSNRSSATLRTYRYLLEGLVRFVGPNTSVRAIEAVGVEKFIDSRDLSPVSINNYLRHLAAFWSFLLDREYVERNVIRQIPRASTQETYPKYLTRREVDLLCDAIRSGSPVYAAQRQWLIDVIRCNVYMGLRRGELINLRWGDVDLESMEIRVGNSEDFRTKSRKPRVIPLGKGTAATLVRRRELGFTHVFTTGTGNQLNGRYVTRMFRKYALKAGLGVNFHSLRHTACTWLAEAGTPVEAIRLFAGHSSIMVTQRYMHVSPDVYRQLIREGFGHVG